VPTAVLNGLAANPAAPSDVLINLIDRHGADLKQDLAARREMPAPLVEAMLNHPVPEVRCALGANPYVDLRIRVRLVDDPDPVVVAWVRHDRTRPLPAEAVDQYLEAFDRTAALGLLSAEEARFELSRALSDDPRLLAPAARHPNPNVRAAAVFLEERLEPRYRRSLRNDPAPAVRQAFADYDEAENRTTELAELVTASSFSRWMQLGRRLTPQLVDHVLAQGDTADLQSVAANRTLPPAALEALLAHPAPEVRSAAARRGDLTADQLARLVGDPHPLVRNAVSTHPALSEQQRATIDVDLGLVPGEGDFRAENWPIDPFWTVDELTEWALSSNVLLRRRAARSPELPAFLVPVLADDGDLGVRVLLALTRPDAPPQLLLRCYLEYTGNGREALLHNPGFPQGRYAQYAEHPDPALRRLVALDPDAEPKLLVRLLSDQDPDVRCAAAASPRLLPRRIVQLLDDPELAAAAASNPALPVQEMWRLIG